MKHKLKMIVETCLCTRQRRFVLLSMLLVSAAADLTRKMPSRITFLAHLVDEMLTFFTFLFRLFIQRPCWKLTLKPLP